MSNLINKTEKRFFEDRAIKHEPGEDGPGSLKGRGIVFNKWSNPVIVHDWKGRKVTMLEKIDARSLDNVDLSDVISYYNHTPPILGRTKSDTLKLEVNEKGMDYVILLPNTQAGNDVAVSASRKDIAGSSFQFRVAPDGEVIETKENEEEVEIRRTITKFSMIKEVGPVDDPAYNGTGTSLKRDMDELSKEILIDMENQEIEERKTPVKDKLKLRMRKRKLFKK